MRCDSECPSAHTRLIELKVESPQREDVPVIWHDVVCSHVGWSPWAGSSGASPLHIASGGMRKGQLKGPSVICLSAFIEIEGLPPIISSNIELFAIIHSRSHS